jgi:hypothetical protein
VTHRHTAGFLLAAGLLGLAAAVAAGEPAGGGRVLVVERIVREWGRRPAVPAAGTAGETAAPAPAPEAGPAAAPGTADEIVQLHERHFTVRLAPQMTREQCEAAGTTTIVRFDLQLIWLLDDREKTFRELSFSSLNESTARARERLERRLPAVSDPALRGRLAAALGVGTEPPATRIDRPQGTRIIAGEKCSPIRALLGTEPLFEGWVADRAEPPLSGRQWLQLGGVLGAGAAESLAGIKGLLMEATFPLPDGGRLEVTTLSLTEEKAAQGDFADPATFGYKPTGRRAREEAAAEVGGGK